MKETFYLVRHGRKAGGINPPLSELGVKQAKAVAEHLATLPIQSIVVSPLLRTIQTAEYIQCYFKLDLVIEELLKERLSWGDPAIQPGDDFNAMWKRAYLERDWQPTGGYSSVQSGQRLQQAIEKHSQANHEHTALVTHAGIITDFLLNIFGTAFLNTIRPDFSQKNDKCIHEASITIIKYDSTQKSYALDALGTTTHLPDELLISK